MKEELFGKNQAAGLLPKRSADTDKADYGNLLLVVGSREMMGAAILTAKSALRMGAGLVRVALPENCFGILQTAVPEAICMAREEALDSLKNEGHRYDALVLGPGLGKGEEVREILEKTITYYEGPMLVDADGLNAISENPSLREAFIADGNKRENPRLVITPHKREGGRLLGRGAIQKAERFDAVRLMAETFGAVALLKGSGTLVTGPAEDVVWQNTTGNHGMATAGSGDVLTGIIGTLLGQKVKPLDAAKLGAYLHGRAGDLAARDLGPRSLMAGDIVNYLPQGIIELEREAKVYY